MNDYIMGRNTMVTLINHKGQPATAGMNKNQRAFFEAAAIERKARLARYKSAKAAKARAQMRNAGPSRGPAVLRGVLA